MKLQRKLSCETWRTNKSSILLPLIERLKSLSSRKLWRLRTVWDHLINLEKLCVKISMFFWSFSERFPWGSLDLKLALKLFVTSAKPSKNIPLRRKQLTERLINLICHLVRFKPFPSNGSHGCRFMLDAFKASQIIKWAFFRGKETLQRIRMNIWLRWGKIKSRLRLAACEGRKFNYHPFLIQLNVWNLRQSTET